ncbi:MAG: helix-turn-helix transcriptional regulator [Tepidisphaeraceae bacterium]
MPARSPYAGASDLRALGRALRDLRQRRGVPQVAVSFDTRVTKNYIGMTERGDLNPSFLTLLWVVRTLGFTLAELVEVYDRHLAVIDPDAGHDVPRCPTPAALAHCAGVSARETAKTRGRI